MRRWMDGRISSALWIIQPVNDMDTLPLPIIFSPTKPLETLTLCRNRGRPGSGKEAVSSSGIVTLVTVDRPYLCNNSHNKKLQINIVQKENVI